MTDLQKMYARLRSRGFNHRTACESLAQALGVDVSTIRRCLNRAADHNPPKEEAA